MTTGAKVILNFGDSGFRCEFANLGFLRTVQRNLCLYDDLNARSFCFGVVRRRLDKCRPNVPYRCVVEGHRR